MFPVAVAAVFPVTAAVGVDGMDDTLLSGSLFIKSEWV